MPGWIRHDRGDQPTSEMHAVEYIYFWSLRGCDDFASSAGWENKMAGYKGGVLDIEKKRAIEYTHFDVWQ